MKWGHLYIFVAAMLSIAMISHAVLIPMSGKLSWLFTPWTIVVLCSAWLGGYCAGVLSKEPPHAAE